MRIPRFLALSLLVVGTEPGFTAPILFKNSKKAVLYLTSQPPSIDGTYAGWKNLEGTAPRIFVFGEERTKKAPSGIFFLQTDNKCLYILVDVIDSTANENSLPVALAWQNDSVEVYLSTDLSPHQAYSQDDRHLRLVPRSRNNPNLVGISINDIRVDNKPGVKAKCLFTAKGYRIEAQIPLRRLSMKKFFPGQAFRAEFQINDGNTGKRENLLHWSSPQDAPFYDAAGWGSGIVQAVAGNSNEQRT